MQALELKVAPLLLLAVFAAGMFGLSQVVPAFSAPLPGGRVAALLLALVGIGLVFVGGVAFRAHKTTVNPRTPGESSSVVSSGVYRVSRNPMYLGFLLALAGWAVYLSNAVAVLLLPAFVVYMNQFQIKPEERALLTKFGSAFAAYMASVRRWL